MPRSAYGDPFSLHKPWPVGSSGGEGTAKGVQRGTIFQAPGRPVGGWGTQGGGSLQADVEIAVDQGPLDTREESAALEAVFDGREVFIGAAVTVLIGVVAELLTGADFAFAGAPVARGACRYALGALSDI